MNDLAWVRAWAKQNILKSAFSSHSLSQASNPEEVVLTIPAIEKPD